MSEHQAPYLRIVRSAPSALPSTSPAKGAQEADAGEHTNEAGDASDGQPASSSVAGEAMTDASATAAEAKQDVPLNQPLQQAIMYAAVSWVALCIERATYAVDIQPIARRIYEVSMHYADADGQDAGDGIMLRVRLEVEAGLVLRTTVEPVRP